MISVSRKHSRRRPKTSKRHNVFWAKPRTDYARSKKEIASLQAKYEECVAKKEELEFKTELCTARLTRAEKVPLHTRDDSYWTSRENSLELIELSSINEVSLVPVSSCSNTGSIRDDPYWTSRKNSLELIELSSRKKISLV